MNSHASQLIRASSTPFNLLWGVDRQGRTYHYVFMASKETVKRLMDSKEDLIDLTKYGRIIASGWGRTPSEEARNSIKSIYDIDIASLCD